MRRCRRRNKQWWRAKDYLKAAAGKRDIKYSAFLLSRFAVPPEVGQSLFQL
ncbi:hypothetical protein [Eikenella halliae]|uniref:hypothetical protein n=1 Tax=Eikenella halliae TaxID=1795832 RepID=UPI0028D8CC44|nr:hypothetical protein [Eikenella halliae]